jgi:hypothetical protein
MALPLKTTDDDVRQVVAYFKTKPTGATVTEAKSAVRQQLVDPRKMSAYRFWGILTKEGDRYKLAARGWELARKPEREEAVFRQVIDSVSPYRSVTEWMFHQDLDSVTVIDVASHWHEHHLASLGADVKDATIRENAVSFFRLCEAAGLGKIVLGRGGNPTRLEIDRARLKEFIEAGPSEPPWVESVEESDSDLDDGVAEPSDAEEDQEVEEVSEEGLEAGATRHPPSLIPPERLRAFISHGKNMEIVEQVQTLLELADIDSEIAEEEETTAIPVPEKVFNAMRRCQAGIIVVSVEEGRKNETGDYTLNDNVLIEIGAAFVLYDKRVVLVWDKRLPVPSNLQGLYRCEYEGDELTLGAGMKMAKAIQQFKK